MLTLRTIFDYQKFAGNDRLERIIQDTEKRYGRAKLMDDELTFVNAAGILDISCLDKKED